MTERIFQYLDKRMTAEERKVFEQELESNAALREELQLCEQANDFFDDINKHNDIKAFVKEVHAEVIEEMDNESKRIRLNKIIGMAAAIVMLLGVIGVIKYTNSSLQLIFNNNYTAYAIDEVYRGTEHNDMLAAWFKAYDNEAYEQVVTDFENLTKENIKNPAYGLMYACALIELERFDAAVLTLENTKVEDNVFLQAKIDWYLGLSYLALQEKDKARLLFEKLQSSSEFNEAASKILKKLTNITSF